MKKICHWKLEIGNFNSGMTYVELIVVLSIFSILSGTAIFNYHAFQAKIDVNNLASDIAQEIVRAQKSALGGLGGTADWRPAYGVHFDTSTPDQFIYFADVVEDGIMSSGEELRTIKITGGSTLKDLVLPSGSVSELTVSFSRPDSGAKLFADGSQVSGSDHAEIIVKSRETEATIEVYPSGRINVK